MMSLVPPIPTQPRARWFEIDGLRGLCALAVMAFHFSFRIDEFVPREQNPLMFSIPGVSIRIIGEIPVYVFFMISGFVISFTLDHCRTWNDFVVSRFSRLFPTYWTVTVGAAVVWTAFPILGRTVAWTVVAVNMTMLQEFLRVDTLIAVYWSLTAELAFYALMLAIFASGRWPRVLTIVAYWLAASVIFGVACAIFGPRQVPVPTLVATALNLFHAPYFAAGIAFYSVTKQGWTSSAMVLIGGAIIGYFAHLPIAAAAILTCVTGMWVLVIRGNLRALAAPPLQFLGTVSYALYLCHTVVGFAMFAALPQAGLAIRFTAAFAASLIVATVLTYGIEKPALNGIRRRYRRHVAVAR
jgi:peptidoglycan/LPS O-acetylase OafA/YrhL